MQFICLKEKKFHRSLAFCLVFFISFSVCFGFRSKKVKANPLVGVAESEVVSVIVNILSSFGVVVSIPTAREFLEQEKDFCTQKALELQNHKGAVTKGIQALKEGFYVSKDFCKEVLDKWNYYAIKAGLDSTTTPYTVTVTFPSCQKFYRKSMFAVTIEEMNSYYSNCFSSCVAYIPISYPRFKVTLCRGELRDYYCTVTKSRMPDCFGCCTNFTYSMQQLSLNGHMIISGVQSDTTGIIVDLDDDYKTKPKPNQKVIDNVLDPVNSQSQGMVISPKQVESVGKVLDPSIPDVPSSSIVNNAPISSVASTYPNVVDGADVGALPWSDVGSIDKPTDIPKDESKDIPKDESKDESKDVPKDEPVDKPKENEGVDFSPFLTLGSGLKDVFPFCLPFDLIKNLHLLSAPPQAPHFDIDFKKAGLAGGDVISIDFSQFELLAKIIRFFLTLGFIYFLIIKTRDMIRG